MFAASQVRKRLNNARRPSGFLGQQQCNANELRITHVELILLAPLASLNKTHT